MKTIILILLVGFLTGCSNYNASLKKTDGIHQKGQIADKREDDNHISSIFKSTLSSFVPIDTDSLDGGMAWQQMLKDYYMNSNAIYYILFGISFIVIGLLMFAGARNKTGMNKSNKLNV